MKEGGPPGVLSLLIGLREHAPTQPIHSAEKGGIIASIHCMGFS